MINKTRCTDVAGVYEWVQFAVDPIIIIILFQVWWLHGFSWQISYLFINWIWAFPVGGKYTAYIRFIIIWMSNTRTLKIDLFESKGSWAFFPLLCLADLSYDHCFSQSRATPATLFPPPLIEVRQKRCLLNTFVTNQNFNPEEVSAVLRRAGGWLLRGEGHCTKNLCTSVIPFFYVERNNLSKPDKTQFEFTG